MSKETSFERSSSNSSSIRSSGVCRKRLKDTFDQSERKESKDSGKGVFSVVNLNDTRRYIRNGTERLSKTFNSVRVSIESFSQHLKISTKRRQILQEGSVTPNTQTPCTRAKQVLGRTPTKLYSPFGIESPYNSTTIDKENMTSNT